VIAFLRGDGRAEAVIAATERLVVPVAVVAELLAGCLGADRRAAETLRRVQAFLGSTRVTTTPATSDTAERWAVIWDALKRAGRPVPANDVWIAASAMEYGLPVITLDRHFLAIPQVMVTLVGEERT
jgi:tRNA(fMet)-specific endonuclease VapC